MYSGLPLLPHKLSSAEHKRLFIESFIAESDAKRAQEPMLFNGVDPEQEENDEAVKAALAAEDIYNASNWYAA